MKIHASYDREKEQDKKLWLLRQVMKLYKPKIKTPEKVDQNNRKHIYIEF